MKPIWGWIIGGAVVIGAIVLLAHDQAGKHRQIDLCLRATRQSAVDACTKAIASGGADGLWRAYVTRANAYVSLHQYAKALSDFDTVIRQNPGSAAEYVWVAYIDRGQTYWALHQYGKALNDFDTVIRRNRTGQTALVVAAYMDGANVYMAQHQYEKAVAYLDTAVRLNAPGSAGFTQTRGILLNNRCWARAIWGQQLNVALADCNEAVSLHPNRATFLGSRALVQFRQGNYAAAIADGDEAIALAKRKGADVFYIRGLAKLKIGDRHDGQADIDAAEKINPAIAGTYAAWGVPPANK